MATAAHREVERLIAEVALGDRRAFDTLYSMTSGRLFAVCLSVLRDRAEAEDTLQEVYLRVWNAAGRYAVNGLSPMTWLITIARNRSIDRLRARSGAPASAPVDEAVALPAPAPGPEAATIHAEEQGRLHDCLNTLEDARAGAVRAVYLEGASYAEIASAQNIPLNTVRTWLRRSLLRLRECLSHE